MADQQQDLGFGARVAQQSRERLLNHDGSFNVQKTGLPLLRSLSLYNLMLTLTWGRFFLLVAAMYVAVNIGFAIGYMLCGPGALEGTVGKEGMERFLDYFFFSVQTLATIGYGKMNPNNFAANALVALEALVGMLSMTLATGLMFARFSRPTADFIFSRNAIVAPYRDMSALQFRVVNSRSNNLTEVEAVVVANIGKPGSKGRSFHELPLERSKVMFLPLHWVIVHPIDEASPLHGMDPDVCKDLDVEILILIKAMDETFSQSVHVRASYKQHEILWNRKFRDMFLPMSDDGVVRIDVRRIHDVEEVA